MVTGFSGAQSPNLSFQCSCSLVLTSRTLYTLAPPTCYQWLPPVAIFRVYRGWFQEFVIRQDAVVRLNGEFVHTA